MGPPRAPPRRDLPQRPTRDRAPAMGLGLGLGAGGLVGGLQGALWLRQGAVGLARSVMQRALLHQDLKSKVTRGFSINKNMLKAVHVDFNQMCRERIKRNLPGLEDLGLFLLHCRQANGVQREWATVTAEQCQKGTLEHMGMLERLR